MAEEFFDDIILTQIPGRFDVADVEQRLLNFCSFAPGSNFFGKTPLFFRYSGVNAANAVNLQAKRR